MVHVADDRVGPRHCHSLRRAGRGGAGCARRHRAGRSRRPVRRAGHLPERQCGAQLGRDRAVGHVRPREPGCLHRLRGWRGRLPRALRDDDARAGHGRRRRHRHAAGQSGLRWAGRAVRSGSQPARRSALRTRQRSGDRNDDHADRISLRARRGGRAEPLHLRPPSRPRGERGLHLRMHPDARGRRLADRIIGMRDPRRLRDVRANRIALRPDGRGGLHGVGMPRRPGGNPAHGRVPGLPRARTGADLALRVRLCARPRHRRDGSGCRLCRPDRCRVRPDGPVLRRGPRARHGDRDLRDRGHSCALAGDLRGAPAGGRTRTSRLHGSPRLECRHRHPRPRRRRAGREQRGLHPRGRAVHGARAARHGDAALRDRLPRDGAAGDMRAPALPHARHGLSV